MKAVYKKLLKIKNPVLIETLDTCSVFDRYRILYPCGRCDYDEINRTIEPVGFLISCFSQESLEETVRSMEKYDTCNGLLIARIQEIK